MLTNEILLDVFGRIQEEVHAVLEGLDAADLQFRPDKNANSIAWLVWHLTRIQDDHLADLRKAGQVYTAGSWAETFNLPLNKDDTGWNHSSDQVAQVTASGELLKSYYDAVHRATVAYIKTLKPTDYGRIVDHNWNPPVTLAVRLVSVISDDLQHVGQAAYVRGLLAGQ